MTVMSTRELKEMLERVEDTRELIIDPEAGQDTATTGDSELHAVWASARDESRRAYAEWCAHSGADRYAVYRAAADRADAAEDALAAAAPGQGRAL